jgi:hypothetical protein
LLASWLAEYPAAPIRLLGVGGSDLSPVGQQDLFGSAGKAGLDRAVDSIRERFGTSSVGRARTLNRS